MEDDCSHKFVDIWKVFNIFEYELVNDICRYCVIVVWYVKMEDK